MRRELALVLTPALVAALAACTSSRATGDRAFAAGDYPAAAAAYEGALQHDPNARSDALLLFRLGLAYADADTPVYEPERAVELLREVVARFPKDRAAERAAQLLPHLEREVRLEATVASERRRVADLEAQLAKALEEAHALNAEVAAREEQLARLRAALADAQAQARRVREELEQLKRIDLQRRP